MISNEQLKPSHFLAGLLVIWLILWLVIPDNKLPEQPKPAATPTIAAGPDPTRVAVTRDDGTYSELHERVKNHFISDEEPTAKDATWTAPDIFKVAVFDDGTPRDGYAESVCMILAEHGFRGKRIWVQIIDMGKILREKRFVKLGEHWCSTSTEPPIFIDFTKKQP